MTASLACVTLAVLAAIQSPAGVVRALAERDADSTLRREVARSPVDALGALDLLLARSARRPASAGRSLVDARRVADAIALEHGDSFPLSEVARFQRWSASQRAMRLDIDSLRRAGNAALRRGGLATAMGDWVESARRAAALGDSASVARALGNIGAGFYGEGALDSAETYFARAARLATSVGDARTALNAAGGLANVHRDRGELGAARVEYARSLTLRARIGDVRGIAADRTNLGILAEAEGDVAGARSAYMTALADSRRYGLREAEATAAVNLGSLASELSDFQSALRYQQRALALYRELGDRQGEAAALHALGLLELRRGDYRRARGLLEEALVVRRAAGPVPEAVTVAGDLARVEAAMGDLRAARARLDTAARLARTAHDAVRLRAGVALLRGDMAAEFNLWADADRHYRAADSAYRRAGDADGMARARHGLGLVRLASDDAEGAAVALESSVQALERSDRRRDAAVVRLDLAAAREANADTAGARYTLAAARRIFAASADPVGLAAADGALAGMELRTGRPAAAERLYRQAIAESGQREVPSLSWVLHAGLADALAAQRRPDAVSEYRQAIADIERIAGTARAAAVRSDWLADKWGVYARLAALEHSQGHDSTAFEVSERLRGRRLVGLAQLGQVAWRSGDDSELVSREQELRRAARELSQVGDGSGYRVLPRRGPAEPARTSASTRAALMAVEAERAELLLTLHERAPGYAAMVDAAPVAWREVATRLDGRSAVLEYLLDDSSATLFVVRQQEVRAVDLGSDRRTIADLVEFASGVLSHPSGPAVSDAVLQRLYRLLIGPAESAGLLRGVERLLIVPHHELHYLPFAALRTTDPSPVYLAQRFAIATAPSVSVWLTAGVQPRPPALSGARVLAVSPMVEQLPGTRREVRAVQAAAPGRTTTLVGEDATLPALLRALPDADILHLATFGVLNRANPLFSFVQLAPTQASDGRLEVHDVFGLPLHARLVVLSACQTGVGSGLRSDVPAGDDWIGVTQAFLAAGASRVVATLWRVDDQATAGIMSRLYGELAGGRDVASALTAAQRAALAEPATADPFYWAGITVVGGW